MGKKIVRKAFVNKTNGQLSVTIPKKKLKKMNPSIKFNEDLFVKLEILKDGKRT